MTITTFQEDWTAIAERFGLSLELDHQITLGGATLTVPVLLRGYGAPRGMLLVTDFDLIRNVAKELAGLGYGFSCLSASPDAIDWPSVAEMLQDWGATG